MHAAPRTSCKLKSVASIDATTGQALLWLRDVDVGSTQAVMLFDSCYAANMVTGRWQPNANVALVEWARKLLANVEATGRKVH